MPYADPEKQRKYMREWMAKRKARWLAENGPCVQCGSWWQLEVDHIDPSTKTSHKVWSWSQKRQDVELAKCQVLCHDCHAAKTAKNVRRGESVTVSKLTAAQVRAIRDEVAAGATKRGTARKYEIDDKNVRLIVARKAWAHIE